MNDVFKTYLKFASLIRSKNFEAWLSENNGRFNWSRDAKSLLEQDLKIQLKTILHTRHQAAFSDEPLYTQLLVLADKCESYVLLRSEDELKSASFFLDRKQTFKANLYATAEKLQLSKMGCIEHTGNALWNSLIMLTMYISARYTLEVSTKDKAFEKHLRTKGLKHCKEAWPYDLLAIDARQVRGKTKETPSQQKNLHSVPLYVNATPVQAGSSDALYQSGLGA